mgnify:FL=1
MSFLFGKKKSPAGYFLHLGYRRDKCSGIFVDLDFLFGFCFDLFVEILRENKRMLDRSIRDIERERTNLQAQEKKLILEIKKTAKQNQMVCGLSLARILFSRMESYHIYVKMPHIFRNLSLCNRILM